MKAWHTKVAAIGSLILGGAAFPLLTACANESAGVTSTSLDINPVANELAITSDDKVTWNGAAITLAELESLLQQTAAMENEPELLFSPDVNANYDISSAVLRAIKDSGVAKFGFFI